MSQPTNVPDSVISFVVVARHNGMSCYRIASLLNRIGTPPLQGGRQWWPSTVQRISERHGPLGAFAYPPARRAG